MDVMPECRAESSSQSECISSQPVARLPRPPESAEEQVTLGLSVWTEGGKSSEDSSAIRLSVSDTSLLLPTHTDLAPPPLDPKGKLTRCDVTSTSDSSSVAPPPACTCTPPPRRHLSSTTSHTSFKVDAAHIKEVAGDDCCVHCLLACLFCELLSMCSAVGACLPCARGGAGCCTAADDDCCCCCMEAACTGEACQAVSDCGMLEECCSSADCLEICLECCSICFPS